MYDAVHTTVLVDSNATRETILQALESFLGQATPVDVAVDAPLQWTPTIVHWGRSTTNTGTALEDNTVGTSVIDALVGLKLRLPEGFVLTGGVGFRSSVPCSNRMSWERSQ